jgi:flagellar basal-body rod protein FlgF
MDNTSYVSLSGAMALRRNMDITTNNMANLETGGFKAEHLVFEEYLTKQENGERKISFVIDKASYLDTAQGGLTRTGGDLDVAIQGKGWFGYLNEEGKNTFGRDGRLLIDNVGNLTTYSGAQILDNGGTPIAIPPGSEKISISNDGIISDETGAEIATIGMFELNNVQKLDRIGGGMLMDPENPPNFILDQNSMVLQGFTEKSNVEPIVELTRMMEIQRSYEQTLKMGKDINDLKRDTIKTIGRT